MKKVVAMCMCAVMAFSMTACGNSKNSAPETAEPAAEANAAKADATEAETAEADAAEAEAEADAAEKEHYKIGFTFQEASQPFHATIRDEIQSIVEANGDTFVYADPAHDQQLQIDQVNDMITQGIDVLIMNPVENDGVLPALEACKQAGVPIIAYDCIPVDEEYITSFIASDNLTAGKLVGEYMMEHLEEGSKVGVMWYAHSDSIIARTNGFKEAVGDYFDIVVGEVADATKILETAEDLLQANPDMAAIFGNYEGFTMQAYAAVQGAGLGDKVAIYGVDGAPAEKAAIAEGGIVATAAQSPVGIADKTIEVVYQYLAGEEIEDTYLLDSFIIDANNVAEYGTDDWQ